MKVIASGPITSKGAVAGLTLRGSAGTERVVPCLMDIGSSRTFVLKSVLARVGAIETGYQDRTETLVGQESLPVYRVAVTIGTVAMPSLYVTATQRIPDGMKAVIGRDIIDRFHFDYGGSITWRWELTKLDAADL